MDSLVGGNLQRMRHVRATPIAVIACGVVAAPCATGLADARGLAARAPSASPSPRAIRRDERAIDGLWHDCRAFSPGGCTFGNAAWTPSASGPGVLYAIDLRRTAGDACGLGEVYFFDGERLIAGTAMLEPHAAVTDRSPAVSSAGPRSFIVRYAVNRSARAPCAAWGDAGVDGYLYRWDGRRMVAIAGDPPRPPRALAPSL